MPPPVYGNQGQGRQNYVMHFLKNLKAGGQCHAMKPECSLKQTLNNVYVSQNINKVFNNKISMLF
jgi:hypothetical protein